MSRILPISLLAASATCALTTMAFAGTPVSVPEPTSLALLATGMGAVYLVRRWRRKE